MRATSIRKARVASDGAGRHGSLLPRPQLIGGCGTSAYGSEEEIAPGHRRRRHERLLAQREGASRDIQSTFANANPTIPSCKDGHRYRAAIHLSMRSATEA